MYRRAESQRVLAQGRQGAATGLPKDSVVNVTALVTLNKDEIEGPVGTVPDGLMHAVNQGLRRVLGI